MTRRVIRAISERTNREWPKDHPGRRGSVVLTNKVLRQMTRTGRHYLICSYVGEERLPPFDGDADVPATCGCGQPLIKRRSAPSHLIPVCGKCWEHLATDQKPR